MGSVGDQSNLSTMASKQRQSNRIQVKNFPVDMTKDAIEHLLSSFGTLLRCEIASDNTESFIKATYELPDQAQSAVNQLNDFDINGYKLQVQLLNDNNRKSGQRTGARAADSAPGARTNSYPLRILVPSELVGAVIGKKGVTIRNITTQCKARVDVHGKDSAGLLEKVISIYGQPENCSSACKEILQVIHKEPPVESHSLTVPLKMVIDDRYCGRIIGKEGKIIKKIREDTETRITISSVQEMTMVYPDRVITIQGGVDNMVAAQAAISAKLAECIDKDVQMGSIMMMSGMPVAPAPYSHNMQRLPYGVTGGCGSLSYQPAVYGVNTGPYTPGLTGNNVEVCQIIVPDKAVGAIIGAGGSMIKQIMEDSGAYVTVEPRKEADGSSVERIVTIRGTSDACWKASYFIFEKVKDESSAAAGAAGGAGDVGDVKLRTMLAVPRSVAGRIIGRSGKTVREIQRMTGAMVKLSEDTIASHTPDETVAEIYGNFMATQGAHARIRALMSEEYVDGYPGGGPAGAPSGDRPLRNGPPASRRPPVVQQQV